MRLVADFVPIWLLSSIGYLARRRGLLGEGAAVVLGRFVFHLAMPAALFTTLSAMPLSRFSYASLVAFGASTVIVVGAGWVGAGRIFGRKPAERPIWGMASGYVNSANLGIPITQQVLGNVSFIAEVVLFQSIVVMPVILIALDRSGDTAKRVRFRRIAGLPIRNPGILASVSGVIWSATGLPAPPTPIAGSLRLLAAAAVPVGLVALGASLHSSSPVGGRRVDLAELSALTAVKLVAQPLIALAIGLFLHLSHAQLLTVVLCAGLPTAQNTFIFAQEYGVAETIATRSVVLTTVFALGTLLGITVLIGQG